MRPITLFTGQFADMPLEALCAKAREWGFDGLELACWGDHFDVEAALADEGYVDEKLALLAQHDLGCWAISNHLVGQAVCDPIDERHRAILPQRVWGDGDPEGVRRRAAAEMQLTARAAERFGVDTVCGFTGSSIWHLLAGFPPVPPAMLDAGYQDFADRWHPIVDVFDECGVRFALEVHPSEIAYDFWTTQRTLEAIGRRPGFGINFDPSHLNWQLLDPVAFLTEFADRIYHVHAKDTARNYDGRNGVLASHLPFGDLRRGWDFVSPGHGSVPFERIVRALNAIGYGGPLSVEWEDSGMSRERGAPEASAYLRSFDFEPPASAFDAAFASERIDERIT
jgi:sugar phosphate isomerase/epimerase